MAKVKPIDISRIAKRRAELVEAAIRAIRRKGPDASMDEMAAEAGITKPIIYRHFGDKAGLYREIADSYVRSLVEQLKPALLRSGEPRTHLAELLKIYFEFTEQEGAIYRFLTRQAGREHPEARAALDRVCAQVGEWAAGLLGERVIGTKRDPNVVKLWGYSFVGTIYSAADWWFATRAISRDELVARVTDLLWSGIGAMSTEPFIAGGQIQLRKTRVKAPRRYP
jgi:AcrR family transcriptional regulator